MSIGPHLKRRGFLGAALLAAGGALGFVAAKKESAPRPRTPRQTTKESRFAYDVSEFQKTDPVLLRYRSGGSFHLPFKRIKRLGPARRGTVWAAGDRSVKLFGSDGVMQRELLLDRPPHCICAGDGDQLLVGFGPFFEIYDREGKRLLRSSTLGQNSFVTGLAVYGGKVIVADAGNREIAICDRASGKVIDRFGKKDSVRGNPGLVVPSPYLDLAIAPGEKLLVANPGRLRVETYSLDGRFESSWGEPGLRIDRFCGCCNPVYFALTPQGDLVTSEKGLVRINIYGRDGTFKGAVAGPEHLTPGGKEQTAQAASVNELGGGFDVAVEETGRIYALDAVNLSVRVFEPNSSG
jgi:hypothetical protein